jgi:iron complex outermembrane receptor protein
VLLAANVDRRITGITLQDRIDVRDNVSVTIGARHDTYSDLQSRTTPRLSIVWRASDRHILKAQYAEGFRPPTFFELYQPPPPNTTPRYPFEVNATTELNYIFRTAGRVARATVFRSVISDIIRPGGFVTPGQARATGFELEGTQQLGSRLKLDVNVSHVTTHDPRSTAGPDVVAAGWLANAGLYYEPLRDTFVGLRVNHVGDRYAAAGYDVADLTLARQDIVTRGLTVRAGVKNALNDHPVYIQLRPNGVTDLAIFPGRSVWLQLSFSR